MFCFGIIVTPLKRDPASSLRSGADGVHASEASTSSDPVSLLYTVTGSISRATEVGQSTLGLRVQVRGPPLLTEGFPRRCLGRVTTKWPGNDSPQTFFTVNAARSDARALLSRALRYRAQLLFSLGVAESSVPCERVPTLPSKATAQRLRSADHSRPERHAAAAAAAFPL
ncbi:unnamed protein product [Lampetra planeri]